MEPTNPGSQLLQARPRLVPPSVNLPSKPQRNIRSLDVIGSSWRAARSAAPRAEGLEQGEDVGGGGESALQEGGAQSVSCVM